MPFCLHPSCESFVGQTIYVRPVHGWGWCRRNRRPDESPHLEVPSPFLLRVMRLTQHRGELNGFMGQVEAPEHPFNGLWGLLI